ncbi:hypothetical protein AB0H28_15140 [Micromonospora sp. NPDC050980]|uniref:hypothetical protein n=1 Tax=Micromonospora sp. NPDC050980 TaxID=3155161 RepID=UPI0033E45733
MDTPPGNRADATVTPAGTGADGWPARDGVLPLSLAPARRGPAVVDGSGRHGTAGHGRARIARSSRADGSDPTREAPRLARLRWRPDRATTTDDGDRRRAHHPWPALPGEAGATGSGSAGRPVDGRPTAGGAARPDRWPALPDEQASRPATTSRPTWHEAVLDREQAGR